MIRSIKVTGGYAEDLPALKGRTFEFTEGINILWGPNGTGKSTLCRVAGAYSGCQKEGGWSMLGHDKGKAAEYPELFEEGFYPASLSAEVDWDGMATFLTNASDSDSPVAAFGMPSDGLMGRGMQGEIANIFARRDQSSGQNRTLRINSLGDALMTPPDLVKDPLGAIGSDPDQLFKKGDPVGRGFRAYVQALPRKGPITLVADEIDRSLDLPFQAIFLTRALPNLARVAKCQVILASHSPFALLIPGANIIDLRPGYETTCREFLEGFGKSKFDDVCAREIKKLYGQRKEPK